MTVNRMLVDVAGDGVFRISKAGVDVNTAGPLQLAFSESRSGLIPSAKGSFAANADIALPDVGSIPIIFFAFEAAVIMSARINEAKTLLQIRGSSGGRYVIFRNKQF